MAASYNQVTIIGVGLMGGSLGLAIKAKGLADKVVGVGRSAERLRIAQDKGAIDSFSLSVRDGCAQADLVVLCLPVSLIIESLKEVAQAVSDNAVVTDVGSTKVSIVAEAQKWFTEKAAFVGSHPMTGSEKSGVEFAGSELYEQATCFVTVDSEAPHQGVARITEFWRALGARPLLLSPEQHDYLVALSSHVPHIASVGLCALLAQADVDENFIKLIVGPGFLDTTRIAQSDPKMWLDIIKHNQQNILQQVNNLRVWLEELSTALCEDEVGKIQFLLDQIKTFRQKLNP